jgi:hypothetical protein
MGDMPPLITTFSLTGCILLGMLAVGVLSIAAFQIGRWK